MNQELKKE